MRTQEEILGKIEEVKEQDWMGTTRDNLIKYLEYENAKDFLKEGVIKSEWEEDRSSTDKDVLKEMVDYLDFAFGKAQDQRGLSAGRSMDHYYAWIWLIGEEGLFGDVREYNNYGLSHLEAIEAFLIERGELKEKN